MHGVDDFEVDVLGLLKADPLGLVGEVPDLDCDLVELVDFNILEDDFCGDDFEVLGVDGFLLRLCVEFGGRTLIQRLHCYNNKLY